jgi:hypothetical protein
MADLSILNRLLNLLLFFFSGDLAAAAFSAGFAAATNDQIEISRMLDADQQDLNSPLRYFPRLLTFL